MHNSPGPSAAKFLYPQQTHGSSNPVWCPVFHWHQPPYDAATRHYYDECAERSYRHHLDVLEAHPGIMVNLNVTGTLLELMERYNPEFIDRIRNGSDRGQIHLTGTADCHAILPLVCNRYGDAAARLHIEKDIERKRALFGTMPKAFRFPEYAVDERTLALVGEYHDIALLSGVTYAAAGLQYGVPYKKGNLVLLCRDDGLSNLLSGMDHYGRNYFTWFRDYGGDPRDAAEEFAQQLLQSPFMLTDLDGEAFFHHALLAGVPHDKAERYLDELYSVVERHGVRTTHLPEFASLRSPVHTDAVIPPTSYYPGGFVIWDGNERHNKLWENIDRVWQLYQGGLRNGTPPEVLNRLERNALRSQASCFTWAVTHDYPSWWTEQPARYAHDSELLLAGERRHAPSPAA